ncbi:hypothetical protein HFP15_15655 [Amycolatopsis sp. K13G38]|uniref:Na+/H+ antiporter subunit E n=1 Tax=Amycolatopsis acididurans TaxID=2724524 RepID=A0ABX1J3G0_9PSEU|nr:Na+/H+ antiporter subunit E [Amycolatopsis acididurans]NKQ54321.1 hypothetical protein [Amycolatopsis acididurans]
MRGWLETVFWWVALVLVWLVTVSTPNWQEVVAAVVLALPCAVAAGGARRIAGDRWRPRLGWVGALRALPGAIAHDTVKVFVALAHGEDGRLDHVRLPAEHSKHGQATREAFASAVLSATPGVVVLDANQDHDTLLMHRLDGGKRLERSVRR